MSDRGDAADPDGRRGEGGAPDAPSGARSSGRRPSPALEALLAAVLLATVYFAVRVSPYLAAGAFHDDGVYLAVGKALADGEGYRSLYAIGEPVHVKYPPLLPVLFAGLWLLFGELARVHQVAILLSLLTTSAALGALWWLARARVGLSLPVALVFVAGPFLLEASVQYFNLAISEPYFILAWAAALIFFHRATTDEPLAGGPHDGRDGPAHGRSPPRGPRAPVPAARWTLLGLALAAAVLVRSQGTVLVPAVLLALLVVRAPARGVVLTGATALVPILLWKLWHGAALARGPVLTQPDEGAYVTFLPSGSPGEVLAFLVELVRSQVVHYGTFMPPHLAAGWGTGMALWLAFLALLAVGGARVWRSRPDVVLTAFGSAFLIFLWPWHQDRFVLTLLPFLGLVAGAGWEAVGWRVTGPGRALALGLLVLVAGSILMRQLDIRRIALAEDDRVSGELYFHPTLYLRNATAYVLVSSQWLEANTPPETDLLAPQPVGIWLYTGRQVVNATPAVPDVGPTDFDVPGRFLARRVVEDDPDLLSIWALNDGIARDVGFVQRACPDALEYLGFTTGFTRVAFYRVHAEDACFRRSFLDGARADLEREAAERGT